MSTQPRGAARRSNAPARNGAASSRKQKRDVFLIAADPELAVGELEAHGLKEWAAGVIAKEKEDVKKSWERAVAQIQFLLDSVSATTKNYELDEITFELGFSAEGEIVFVSKASVTTTVSATFKRKGARQT